MNVGMTPEVRWCPDRSWSKQKRWCEFQNVIRELSKYPVSSKCLADEEILWLLRVFYPREVEECLRTDSKVLPFSYRQLAEFVIYRASNVDNIRESPEPLDQILLGLVLVGSFLISEDSIKQEALQKLSRDQLVAAQHQDSETIIHFMGLISDKHRLAIPGTSVNTFTRIYQI